MKNFKLNKGFTLIELLIVIAIIGVLSTLLMVNFVAIRQRSRDVARKADLSHIQESLEMYRADQGNYPVSGSSSGNFPTSCGSGVSFKNAAGTTTYMPAIPCDSLGSTYWNNGVYYYYTGDSGVTYSITACLENTSDKDQNITSTPPTGAPSNCPNNLYYVLQNP